MNSITNDIILSALAKILHPINGIDIVSQGMIHGIRILQNNEIIFLIEVDPEQGELLEPLRQEAERIVKSLSGVRKVTAILTAERHASDPVVTQDNLQIKNKPSWAKKITSSIGQKNTQKEDLQNAPPPLPRKMDLQKNPPLIVPAQKIIAIASGKGGVGKSTVAVNLAAYLSNFGQINARPYRVGLLDADIYGPSVPLLVGSNKYKPSLTQDKKLVPLQKFNMKIMSIGFMVEGDGALIWRGPMVQSALYQMLRDVAWAENVNNGLDIPLDVLIVDMPPGTGDVQLTLAQKISLSGAVIVSTPQDIALIDARKAVSMFRKVQVPILGLIENMSLYVCPSCGHEEHVFGHGVGEKNALGLPFLGEIPLVSEIRLQSDNGIPIVLSNPKSASAQAIARIAEKIMVDLGS